MPATRVGEMLGDQPLYRPAQALRRPIEAALLEQARNVVPAVVWPHPPHCRQPLICCGLDACAKGGLLRRRHLRQRLRPTLADTGIAGELAFGSRGLDSRLRAFGDQRTLELGDGAKNLQRKHALRRRGVDRIPQRSEMGVPGRQILDHLEQMADGSRQAIEAHDDERVADADLADKLGEGRADAGSA